MTNQLKGVRQASIADHKKVSDAIIDGDSDGAVEAMRLMMDEALDLISAAKAQAGRPPQLERHPFEARLPAE